jgi:hypothetical protein
VLILKDGYGRSPLLFGEKVRVRGKILQPDALTPTLSHCTVRGHGRQVFGDMMNTF